MLQATQRQPYHQVARDTWHIQIVNLFEHLQHRFHIDTLAEIYGDYVEQACHLEKDDDDSKKTQNLSRATAQALSAASLLYDTAGLH